MERVLPCGVPWVMVCVLDCACCVCVDCCLFMEECHCWFGKVEVMEEFVEEFTVGDCVVCFGEVDERKRQIAKRGKNQRRKNRKKEEQEEGEDQGH